MRASTFAVSPATPFGYNASMNTVSYSDFQHDPAAFFARVEAGECLVVSRDGRPIAEIRPVVAPPVRTKRPYGLAAGQFVVPPEFVEPLPEDVLRSFEGR